MALSTPRTVANTCLADSDTESGKMMIPSNALLGREKNGDIQQ